jgi:hypothetical protein
MNYERWKVEQARIAYGNMLREHPLAWCWACGSGERDKPEDWFAVWLIERAHIVRNPRREEVRAAVLLCSYCHRVSHGERIVCGGRYPRWPSLTREHLIWLKRERDPEHYDREFLQANSIRRLPLAQKPPSEYLLEYRRRRGPSRHSSITGATL